MIQLLQQIPIDRALLVIFLGGQLYAQFKGMRRSVRDQGQRIGKVESDVAALQAKVSALEAAAGHRG